MTNQRTHSRPRQPYSRPALWGVGLLLMLVLGGCANPELATQLTQLVDQNRAALAAQGVDPHNRLLVQGIDGNLYTVKPDGTDRVYLTNDATSLRQYLQPTWSPTGEQIAWSEIDGRGSEPTAAVTVSRFDGTARQRFETPFAPFYLSWSPDGARLAYLSNWVSLNQPTIALRLVDPASATPLTTLAEGQPLYFTWSPASDRILAHIGGERLEFRDLVGAGTALTTTFATFPTPAWSADGTQLAYALGEPGRQRLVLTDVTGRETQQVTDFDDSISFSLNATGNRLAYAVTPQGVGTAAFGPLYVVDVTTSATRQLSDRPVLAFFWSPDGQKLAYLEVDESTGTLLVRWHVWDGERRRAYAGIAPSRTFLQAYLAFFDQYARSMTIWSPDSQAFAYAAVTETLANRIFVQPLAADNPVDVGPGLFAAWSPR